MRKITFALFAVFILLLFLSFSKHAQQKKSEIKIDFNGQNIINITDANTGKVLKMPLEQYVLFVVAGEMPASYETEAIKAQAVAARTYYCYKKDVSTSSARDQAYCDLNGMRAKWGDQFEAYYTKLKNCVDQTAGEVMVYDGEPIEALYHACSGGQTEDVENVYANARPYLKSVESPNEESYSKFYGTVAVSKENFISTMNANGANIKSLLQIGQIERFESGRVKSIKIGSELYTGKQIRSFFSLNSANFTVKTSSDSVTFSTIGYGHGVGMSQAGANAMAKSGATYTQILTHYYTNVEVVVYFK